MIWEKITLVLRNGEEIAVTIERCTTHSRNPLLDELEIIAEAIDDLLKEKSSFTNSELRGLSHIRQMTRMRKSGKK